MKYPCYMLISNSGKTTCYTQINWDAGWPPVPTSNHMECSWQGPRFLMGGSPCMSTIAELLLESWYPTGTEQSLGIPRRICSSKAAVGWCWVSGRWLLSHRYTEWWCSFSRNNCLDFSNTKPQTRPYPPNFWHWHHKCLIPSEAWGKESRWAHGTMYVASGWKGIKRRGDLRETNMLGCRTFRHSILFKRSKLVAPRLWMVLLCD